MHATHQGIACSSATCTAVPLCHAVGCSDATLLPRLPLLASKNSMGVNALLV
jgi:hypothetical protein